MKKSFINRAWGSVFKKVAIATFALAALFMFNATAVYANDVQERGRIRTEREERIFIPNGIRESRIELETLRFGNRNRTERGERILLPSGILEGLELERGQGRRSIERDGRILLPRGVRNAS